MSRSSALLLGPWSLFVAAAGIAAFFGVVMADTHEPQAIEPDAPRPDGVQVATFALG